MIFKTQSWKGLKSSLMIFLHFLIKKMRPNQANDIHNLDYSWLDGGRAQDYN